MARPQSTNSVPVETVRHKDKRVNIPTEELRDFVADDEKNPKTILYPRDPSLDPQLVWKGKDEQDAKDLEIPAVPIHIQEKIHPQAIIEDLRTQAREGRADEQLGLFGDFNGIQFEELIDLYHHEQKWSNRMILGDSLLVMNSLAKKEGLKGHYDKLKRALRAEIDAAAWSALYSTASRPFAVPGTGKIAIKVINHYGDEVLKVFEVR